MPTKNKPVLFGSKPAIAIDWPDAPTVESRGVEILYHNGIKVVNKFVKEESLREVTEERFLATCRKKGLTSLIDQYRHGS